LILINKNSEFNYVLNIPGISFYQSSESITQEVKNAFPELLVMDGNKLKSYAGAEANNAHVSFITRPLTFEIEDIKKLDRMILRGVFHDLVYVGEPETGKKSILAISHSNDGVNFHTTRGRILESGDYRDIDMGLMARTKSRWFMLSFGAKIAEGSRISFLDSMIAREYTNEKMR
jgi:hypothetical protein